MSLEKSWPPQSQLRGFTMFKPISDLNPHPDKVSENTKNGSAGTDAEGTISECVEVEEQMDSQSDSIPLQAISNANPSRGYNVEIEVCKCDKSIGSRPCIHLLASTGDTQNLKLMLDGMLNDDKTTVFSLLDANERTVLHCAADFRGCSQLAEDCANLVFSHLMVKFKCNSNESMHPNSGLGKKLLEFINAKDKDNYTALYIAAKRENKGLCRSLLDRNADWDIESKRGKSPAEKIFKKIPSVVGDIIEYLSKNDCKYENSFRSSVILDFGSIITYPSEDDKKANRVAIYEEMDFLSNICYTPLDDRTNILKQPLVKVLIYLKWQKIKWYVAAARLFQITWFLLYSYFLIIVYRHDCPFNAEKQFRFSFWFQFEPPVERNTTVPAVYCHSSTGNAIVWILSITLLVDLFLIEIPPIVVRFRRYWHPMKSKDARKYFKRFLLLIRVTHAAKFAFLALTFTTLFPVLMASWTEFSLIWRGWYILAAIGEGLAWVNILYQIGKIPKFKAYIKMLGSVLQILGLVMLIYGALVIAFAMVFCILLPGVAGYASPVEAVLKMFTFFIGELNYDQLIYGENEDNMEKGVSASQATTVLVIGTAVVVLNIALLNFVIGLTVADIQDLKKYISVWEEYSLLWQIFLFDTTLSHFPLSCGRKLLRRLMLFKPEIYDMEHPNLKITLPLETFPKKLRKDIHEMRLKVKP